MNDKHKILTTTSIYHAFNDGAVAAIPLLFPIFKDIFGLSYTQVGMITGGGLLVTLIAQLMIGRISDHKDFRTLLSTGVFLLCASLLLLTQTQGFLSLLLFIFVLRFASSFYHPIGIGWISRTFKKDRLDWAMGMQSAFGDFGAFIAILTTLYIAELKGWVFPFYIWAIIGVLCLFAGVYLTKNIHEKYVRVRNKNIKTLTFVGSENSADGSPNRNIKMMVPKEVYSEITPNASRESIEFMFRRTVRLYNAQKMLQTRMIIIPVNVLPAGNSDPPIAIPAKPASVKMMPPQKRLLFNSARSS